MGIFSQPAQIADSKIFARNAGGRQWLTLSMRLTTETDTALIIPLPTTDGATASDVEFLPMGACRSFFASLSRGFTRTSSAQSRRAGAAMDEQAPRTIRLTEASPIQRVFVPSVNDFGSLDSSFRLPEAALSIWPHYSSYSFAVFVLPAGTNMRIEPLALSFPSRLRNRLFFPTAVAHRQTVRATVNPDCTLYCQYGELLTWDETRETAGSFVNMDRTQGIIDAERLVQRAVLYGERPNRDLEFALDTPAALN